jgi:hypothetical protein
MRSELESVDRAETLRADRAECGQPADLIARADASAVWSLPVHFDPMRPGRAHYPGRRIARRALDAV